MPPTNPRQCHFPSYHPNPEQKYGKQLYLAHESYILNTISKLENVQGCGAKLRTTMLAMPPFSTRIISPWKIKNEMDHQYSIASILMILFPWHTYVRNPTIVFRKQVTLTL